MALINPELIALARVRVDFSNDGNITTVAYEYANGFETVDVDGAPPIFVDQRAGAENCVVLFLTEPAEPGNSGAVPSQAGIKATFDLVTVSTPLDPLALYNTAVYQPVWQYGDYTLAGSSSPPLPPTAYAKVNPQKALRFYLDSGQRIVLNPGFALVDVAVFRNPMTLYRR